jgi:hypothetical protein
MEYNGGEFALDRLWTVKRLVELNADEHLQSLRRMWDALCTIWSGERLLWWYTDHGPRHSFEVARLAGEMAQRCPAPGLDVPELYVLTAGAFLHDVGMQRRETISVWPERYNEDIHETVRRKHAEWSAEMILSTFSHPAPEVTYDFAILSSDYAKAIARVSRGHSARDFETVCHEFSTHPIRPQNRPEPLAGELLAAFLLFADELDLHHSRVLRHPGVVYSPTTRLHQGAHAFVENSQLVSGAGLHPLVELEVPGPYSDQAERVVVWVGRKLSSRERLIRGSFARHSLPPLGPPLFRLRTALESTKQGIDGEAMSVLAHDLAEGELINFKAELDAADNSLSESGGVELVCNSSLVLAHVSADIVTGLTVDQFAPLVVDLASADGAAGTALDVAQQMLASALERVKGLQLVDLSEGSLESLESAIRSILERHQVAVVLLNMNAARASTREWIRDFLQPLIRVPQGRLVSLCLGGRSGLDLPVTRLAAIEAGTWIEWAHDRGVPRTDSGALLADLEGLPNGDYETRYAYACGAGMMSWGTAEWQGSEGNDNASTL